LLLIDGSRQVAQKLPAALMPSFKPINGASTLFLKVLG